MGFFTILSNMVRSSAQTKDENLEKLLRETYLRDGDDSVKVWDRCTSADTWPNWPQSSAALPNDDWMLELEADIALVQKSMRARSTVDPMQASEYWFHAVPGGREAVVKYCCTHFSRGAASYDEDYQFWSNLPDNVLFRTVSCQWPSGAVFSAESSGHEDDSIDFGDGDTSRVDYQYRCVLVLRLPGGYAIDCRFLGKDTATRYYEVEGWAQPNWGGLERLSISPETVREKLQAEVRRFAVDAQELIAGEGTAGLPTVMADGARYWAGNPSQDGERQWKR